MNKNLILFALAIFSCVLRISAQQLEPLEPVSPPPAHGTFYYLSNQNSPPYPFDPSYGLLNVYEWRPGVYLVDDTDVHSGSTGSSTMSGPSPCTQCPTNSGDGGPKSWGFLATNGFRFAMTPYVTNGTSYIASLIDTNPTTKSYQIFRTSGLQGTSTINSAWSLVAFGTNGQTNFTVPMPSTPNYAYYWAAKADDGMMTD